MTDRPLTIEEATKFLEVSDKTVRRMLERGMLTEQERDRGRIVITAASLNAVAEQLAHERGQGDQEANIVLASQTALIKVERERFEILIETKSIQITELSTEVATLKEAQKYMVTADQKEQYQQTIARLEGQLEETRRQVTDLQKQLNPKRWWEFWK